LPAHCTAATVPSCKAGLMRQSLNMCATFSHKTLLCVAVFDALLLLPCRHPAVQRQAAHGAHLRGAVLQAVCIKAKIRAARLLRCLFFAPAGIMLSKGKLPMVPTFVVLSCGYLLASRKEVDSVELPYLNRARLAYTATKFLGSGAWAGAAAATARNRHVFPASGARVMVCMHIFRDVNSVGLPADLRP